MPQRSLSNQEKKTSWKFLSDLEKNTPHGVRYHVLFPSQIEIVLLDIVSVTAQLQRVSIDDRAPLEFSFHLTGYSQGTIQYALQKKDYFVCVPGTSFFSFLPQSHCQFQLAKGERYRILNIYIPPELFLEKFGPQLEQLPCGLSRILEAGKQQPYNQRLPMSVQLRALIEQLFCSPYQGVLQELYLEAKTMEIMVRHLWELAQRPVENHAPSLGPSERNQIHGARDILLGDLANPPSLTLLARAVGLNPNKLNQGFRQEFGMTVFAWYRMTRIERCRELLEQGQLSVDETAQALGFHDTPHFIRLFKQYVGKTPGRYLRDRHR
ncbi:MAG: hypothetical protein CSA22_06890 [Deltaproteobacteria bacterium]|nr:MAG: hypothetical protein CSA22_06890 [Deltaproteobacteria bacterium]